MWTAKLKRHWLNSRLPFDERGFVLVTTTIMLTMLMGMAGIAVDVGAWYLKIEKTQRAADAAALAGAVYLPDRIDKAVATAKRSLKENNIETQYIDSAVIQPNPTNSSQLQVRVSAKVNNAFLPFIGFKKESRFTRMATAAWRPSIMAGDFSNVLGNEPPDSSGARWQEGWRSAAQGQYWLNVGAGGVYKRYGDRYSTRNCGYSDTFGCIGITNTEYRPGSSSAYTEGYDFLIEAESGATGSTLRIQIYDPAFAETGDNCESSELESLYIAKGHDQRYRNTTNEYCTGDHAPVGDTGTPSIAYYQLLDAKTGAPVSSCPSVYSYAPYGAPGPSLYTYRNDPTFLSQFHQWVTICNAPYNSATGAKYVLRAWSQANKGGVNRFAIRGGLFQGSVMQTTATQTLVHISASNGLPVWANLRGSDTRFGIGRIPPGYAGSDVELELYDLGDALDVGTLQLNSSSTRTSGASPTADCKYQAPKSSSWVNLPNCRLTNINRDTGFDAEVFRIRWQVPLDYTCDIESTLPSSNCYLMIRMSYPTGTVVADGSTWQIRGIGDPLRLYPNY